MSWLFLIMKFWTAAEGNSCLWSHDPCCPRLGTQSQSHSGHLSLEGADSLQGKWLGRSWRPASFPLTDPRSHPLGSPELAPPPCWPGLGLLMPGSRPSHDCCPLCPAHPRRDQAACAAKGPCVSSSGASRSDRRPEVRVPGAQQTCPEQGHRIGQHWA